MSEANNNCLIGLVQHRKPINSWSSEAMDLKKDFSTAILLDQHNFLLHLQSYP